MHWQTSNASVLFDMDSQEIRFQGRLRPKDREDILVLRRMLDEFECKVSGMLYLNFKKLTMINGVALTELTDYLRGLAARREDLSVKLISTSVLPWMNQKLGILAGLSDRFSVEQYDKNFYPGQGAVENEAFIPVLLTQAKIIWGEEKYKLRRHGLKEGMSIADICCGIGTFANQLSKEFKPREIVAVDHSYPSLQYARAVAKQFGITGISFQHGDATSLLLEDDRFDFVTCRLSMQIFDKPELILKELRRITRPGGRVYLTNETYSKCFGYPHTDEISWTYQEASRLFALHGMDLECGPRMMAQLIDVGLENILIEPMILTNNNTDPEAFRDVVQSWQEYVIGTLAPAAGENDEYRKRLRDGFQKHIAVLTHPRGFGGWPIWVASARKPL